MRLQILTTSNIYIYFLKTLSYPQGILLLSIIGDFEECVVSKLMKEFTKRVGIWDRMTKRSEDWKLMLGLFWKDHNDIPQSDSSRRDLHILGVKFEKLPSKTYIASQFSYKSLTISSWHWALKKASGRIEATPLSHPSHLPPCPPLTIYQPQVLPLLVFKFN